MTITTNKTFHRNVGCKIRALRKAKGMTLRQVANQLGCSIQNVSSIEHGRYTGTRNLIVLAKILDVSLEALVEDSEHATM